ncbi:DUF5674 family protein [Nostoc sp. 'Peltigera membranacea cyanobiont' 232]|uniref:DUF5674 family protein n=1 Tax=Nostoc sp. 'Peltigera membranacea cyanobiont' 232 TaxID=2014531 RepID=UPI000B95B799|nr:DUF5674 family protein [Nostoc sp. 'Peltigera membranacea cyanobiont' 232]OYE03041.1 hypothetical protein CDG79_20615 [Nostoc sp. 'Peltigera membranacea cyanobiont' 232]
MIIVIKERATLEQVEQMLETLRVYIKVVVDIERGILAGGGEKHAWCEAVLTQVASYREKRSHWINKAIKSPPGRKRGGVYVKRNNCHLCYHG